MVQENQFGGLDYDDPKSYLASVLEIYDTFKMNGILGDVIHLYLFPLSL